jgi:hypothetical protein
MAELGPDPDRSEVERFARAASQENAGLLRELWELVRESRKWWLVPIIVVLLLIGLLLVLGSTAAAPFIYQLF